MAEEKSMPEIRFKGFDGEWKENSLENMTNAIFDGTHQTPKYTDVGIPFFSVENLISAKSNKFISYKDYLKATSVNKAEENDILITRIGNIGFSKVVNWDYPFSIYVTLAVVKQSKQFNSYFLNYNFQSSRYQNEILTNSLLSAVPCKINMNNLRKTKVLISLNLEEQTKIGDYFQQLDTLITLHQRKYDKLLNVKKAMLEKMFPKKGADVPEIRFKGFSEKWEEKELGEIADFYSGGTPSVGNKAYYGGKISFIRSAEINSESTELFITEKGLEHSSAKIVDIGGILYALYGATSGEVGRAKIKGAINQAILAIVPKNDFDNEYIMQWLRKKKLEIISTYLQGGQGNLSGAIVKDLNINLPIPNEQTKIGNFFKKLDTLLTLHQTELEKLKNIKKACLEKMFV